MPRHYNKNKSRRSELNDFLKTRPSGPQGKSRKQERKRYKQDLRKDF